MKALVSSEDDIFFEKEGQDGIVNNDIDHNKDSRYNCHDICH